MDISHTLDEVSMDVITTSNSVNISEFSNNHCSDSISISTSPPIKYVKNLNNLSSTRDILPSDVNFKEKKDIVFHQLSPNVILPKEHTINQILEDSTTCDNFVTSGDSHCNENFVTFPSYDSDAQTGCESIQIKSENDRKIKSCNELLESNSNLTNEQSEYEGCKLSSVERCRYFDYERELQYSSPSLIHCDNMELLSKRSVIHQKLPQNRQYRYHKYSKNHSSFHEQTMMKTTFPRISAPEEVIFNEKSSNFFIKNKNSGKQSDNFPQKVDKLSDSSESSESSESSKYNIEKIGNYHIKELSDFSPDQSSLIFNSCDDTITQNVPSKFPIKIKLDRGLRDGDIKDKDIKHIKDKVSELSPNNQKISMSKSIINNPFFFKSDFKNLSDMLTKHDKDLKLSMTDDTTLYLRKRRFILDTPFSTRSTISYGFIVYASDTGRWAIIQRKHSVEFLLFIRGLYRLTYLPLILSCITEDEATIIHRCLRGGPKIFKNVYLNELQLNSDGLDYALIRMAESRNVVSNLLPKLDLSKNSLSWTWPKGRLHISSIRETPFDCAKREFTEEVEINLPPPLYISDTYVSENIRTITGRNIESRYWIYIIPNEIPMHLPQSHPEVSNRMWADTDQCRELVRHDNLFQQVLSMISTID